MVNLLIIKLLKLSIGLILILIVNFTKSDQVSYGEFCYSDMKCKSWEFLTCKDSRCICIKPDSMTFDPITNSCVTLAGEHCSYNVASTMDRNGNGDRGYTLNLKCIANSTCDTFSGICTCDSQFYKEFDGTCAPKGLHNSNCNQYKDCRTDLNLHCNSDHNDPMNGFCGCSQYDSVYRSDILKCVGLSGKACISHDCVSNAVCDRMTRVLKDPTRSPNSHYKRNEYRANPNYNICKCIEGSLQSFDGTCIASYGERCDNADEVCTKGLKCIHEKCSCPYEGKYPHQKYDNASKECLTFVGGPCGNDTAFSLCVPHASCEAKENDLLKCRCDTGFVENSLKGCDLAFGEKCPLQSAQCDQTGLLSCINRKCGCEDNLQIYDATFKKCLGLVGAPCSVSSTILQCVQRSICVPRLNILPDQGVCECTKGVKFISKNRSCPW